jgi:hypothetical protein
MNFHHRIHKTWHWTISWARWIQSMQSLPIYPLPTSDIIMRFMPNLLGSRVSSDSIVSDYGLDNQAIEVRSPTGAKDFSSNLCVQTGSGAHPASCTVGIGVLSPGVKARSGRNADHSPPSSAEVENEYELYLLSPQAPSWRVADSFSFWA